MRVRSLTFRILFSGLALLWSLAGRAELRITKIAVDGQETQLSVSSETGDGRSVAPLKLLSSAKTLSFTFEGGSESNKCVRLKYKLEGQDTKWIDPSSEMVVWLRLQDRDSNALAGNEIVLKGETPNWNGQPETAPMVSQSMSFVSPCAADRLNVYFISNGGVSVMGMAVLDDVYVTIERATDRTRKVIRYDLKDGKALDSPMGTPSNWIREGPRPEIAQLLKRSGDSANTVLYLHDTDIKKYGVWRTRDPREAVGPGDRVTLTYKIAHSIGRGGESNAKYENLAQGNYWFRVAQVDVNGLRTGKELSFPVVVVPPMYYRAEFWLVISVVGSALLFLVARIVVWRKMQNRLRQSEHQRMLEAERARIARDIHDDLGATLAQIAMLSEMAEADEKLAKPVGTLLHDIFTRAHDTTRKLDEIVWALKPANDTLDHLVGYLCQFADKYLQLAGLHFRLDAPETLPPYTLTSGQRHNLFLTVKEALHNVVKHGRATEVWLHVGLTDNVLHLRIADNGSGQVPAPDAPLSRGSANMKNRMEQLGGSYARTGTKGKGTTVELTLPLKGQTL